MAAFDANPAMPNPKMTKAPCPVCKSQADRLEELTRGDHHVFSCPLCGHFQIGGSYAATLYHREPHLVLSGIIRHGTERGESLGMIDQWKAEELEVIAPRSTTEKATHTLELIAKKAPGHGQVLAFDFATDYPLAYGTEEMKN